MPTLNASPNFLVCSKRESNDILDVIVKIADLEVSGASAGNTMLPDCPFWLAPEIIEQIDVCMAPTMQADMYALAVVLSEVCSGFSPFSDVGDKRDLRNLILEGARPVLPHTLPQQLRDAIRLAWSTDPSVRCTSSVLRKVVDHALHLSAGLGSRSRGASASSSDSLLISIN